MEKWELDKVALKNGDKTFTYQGYKGIIRLQPHGHLCGYVVIPEGSELHGKHYDELYNKVDAHGGLTYNGYIGKDYCIGFDCAHSDDYTPPIYHKGRNINPSFVGKENYRDIEYVTNEIKVMIDQIYEIDNWDNF